MSEKSTLDKLKIYLKAYHRINKDIFFISRRITRS